LKRIVHCEKGMSAFSDDGPASADEWTACFGIKTTKLFQRAARALAQPTQSMFAIVMEDSPLRITSFLFAAAVAAAVVLPSSSFAQSPQCEALRLACENKDFLNLNGAGTCRQYRENCLRPTSYEETCRQLRYQCHHKDELGLEGEGTCRRYRETCH
jgi:hypothetical protein